MYIMNYKGFEASIMEAERLQGETEHGLPPGRALEVYYADSFRNYPENWMNGPGVFVVPVKPNKGLWFDWTSNHENTAIVPTVKGCNPITGLQTSGFFLERYETKCPKHGKDFIGDRYCEECKYKWPAQNYIAYPNILWWDGFRSGDGSVRQFFFTEDSMRDVATYLIGKEATVPAFGFAFWVRKAEHQIKLYSASRGITIGASSMDCFTKGNLCGSLGVQYKSLKSPSRGVELSPRSISFSEKVEVSVGAGARIRQGLKEDRDPIEYWQEAPSAVMTIYFVFKEQFDELKSQGFKSFKNVSDGMLNDIPKG